MRWLAMMVAVGSLAMGSISFANDDLLGKGGGKSKGNSGSSGGQRSPDRGSPPKAPDRTPDRGSPQKGPDRGSPPKSPDRGDPGLGKGSSGGNKGPERGNPPKAPDRAPDRGSPQKGPERGNPPRGPERGPERGDPGLGKGNSGSGTRPERPPIQTPPPRGGDRTPDRVSPPTQGNRNDTGLGRQRDGGRISIDDRTDLKMRDDLLSRRPQGRVGQPNYQGNNNLIAERNRLVEPQAIGRVPIDLRKGSLQGQVLREGSPERVHGRDRNDYWGNYNWRSGYCQYDYRWRDSYFVYPYYSFSFGNRCAVSPWYYYPNLPGYLDITRCRFGGFGLQISWTNSYDWNRWDQYDRYGSNYQLGRAIDDIRRAFERNDYRALGNLIPGRSEVYVKLNDGYGYYLRGDDFYDLMVDNIAGTDTARYTILESKWGSRGEASIWASHEFFDPWGRRQCVYHRYTLTSDRYGFSIAEFEVSPDRFRW